MDHSHRVREPGADRSCWSEVPEGPKDTVYRLQAFLEGLIFPLEVELVCNIRLALDVLLYFSLTRNIPEHAPKN
jgi:hypothetical protein